MKNIIEYAKLMLEGCESVTRMGGNYNDKKEVFYAFLLVYLSHGVLTSAGNFQNLY